MIFQLLDPKSECVGAFMEGEIYDEIPSNATRTWKYAPHLSDKDIEYAHLYCGGRSLDEVCPEDMKGSWEQIRDKMYAYLRSFTLAKISLKDNCFYDLVPEAFLLEYYNLKSKITESVFDTYQKPTNYEFLEDMTKLLETIRTRDLNIDLSKMSDELHEYKARQFWKSVKEVRPYISYDLFGTKTGRLTTCRGSFPILTMAKKYRKILSPTNDCFVELDFNAAELRTLLALSGVEQPTEDIHSWNVEHLYGGKLSREESKKRIFAWLYNPASKDRISASAYKRDHVVSQYFDGSQVTTAFDRTMPCDNHHALNYIIQSTTSDLFLRQMIKVDKALQGKKSFVSFSVHDSLVLDVDKEDRGMIEDLHGIFSETELGKFKTNLKIGKNFGTMRNMEITQ